MLSGRYTSRGNAQDQGAQYANDVRYRSAQQSFNLPSQYGSSGGKKKKVA
jgi:hypothetical protein